MPQAVPGLNLLDKAVKLKGGIPQLAEAIGYTRNAIYQAYYRGQVSPLMAMRIDELFKGKIAKHNLRPDAFPKPAPRRRQPPAQAAE